MPPPFYTVFTAFLTALLAREVGEDVRPPLVALHGAVMDDLEVLATHIGGCKMSNVTDQTKIMITISMNTLPERASAIPFDEIEWPIEDED